MDTPQRWILRNVARRPIELHEEGGVRIVSPDESIEVESIGAQCAALIGRGLLTQIEVPQPAEEDEGEAEAGPAGPKPRRAAARRGESKKNSPRPGVAVVEDDEATGLRKGEGE
ncbi:MAG TPA: hypothetical protein VF759_10435 [Allosphingosinicella sp.]|jgi:hypothetical protein